MNLDKTFCASPQCKNECGRQPTIEELIYFFENDRLMSQAYFCGEPQEKNG